MHDEVIRRQMLHPSSEVFISFLQKNVSTFTLKATIISSYSQCVTAQWLTSLIGVHYAKF